MTDLEVLELARKKEEGAIKLYEGLIKDHPALKDLLYDLLMEEQKHKKAIEKKIFELTRY